jgi:general secretion pathway protein D
MMKCLGAIAGAAILAAGAQARQDEKDLGALLQDVNLHDLTLAVRRITKKAILWTEEMSLRGRRVHLSLERPPSDPEAVFRLYRHILQANDFVLIPSGPEGEEVFRVVRADTARGKAVPFARAEGEPEDRFVTRIFTLRHASVRSVQVALTSLAAAPQNVVPVDEAGVLIVVDYDSNIRRLEEIVRALDVKKPDIEMRVVPLRRALASRIEAMLNTLARTLVSRPTAGRIAGMPGAAGQEPVQVAADDRTNSVVLLAEPGRLDQLEEIVRRLDAESSLETGGISIHGLRHRNALDVARTLAALYRGGTDHSSPPPAPPPAGRPVLPAAPAPLPPAGPQAHALPAGPGPTIVADELSNSVILVTDRETRETLERILRRLDQRRPQVFIKATVAEIRASESFDLGVELAHLRDPKGRFVVGARTSVGLSGFQVDPATGVFTIVPLVTTGATLLGMKDRAGSIPALLHALDTRADVSILDEPEAATTDHGTATMKVSSDIPVFKETLTTGFSSRTVDFVSAETVLQISPHISDGGYLRLETTVRIQKFGRASADPSIPPPKITREITTKEVMVPSGGTMVIGGIVISDQSDSVDGVPFLRHLPLLGPFFRREQKSRERTMLYIFITPTILYGFGEYGELTRERKSALEEGRGGEALPGLRVGPRAPKLPESTFRFLSFPPEGRREGP